MMDDELTVARKAQIDAELEVITLKALVETLECQRDHADKLLRDCFRLLGTSRENMARSPAYGEIRIYLREVVPLDKYERRFIEVG